MNCWTAAARLGALALRQSSRQYASKVSRIPVRVLKDAQDARKAARLRSAADTVAPTPLPAVEEGVEEGADAEMEILQAKPSRLPSGFPAYDNVGKDDSKLSYFSLDTASSRKRDKSGLIMLEGKKLIQEAFDAEIKPKALFFSRVEDVTSLRLPQIRFLFQKVTYDKIQRWSKLTTPPGVIGFFEMPTTSTRKTESALPFSIICDNVRDPGNLGSILRIAASAGCKKVLLSKGCVDLWNDKVLRAAMGSHFHICIQDQLEWKDIEMQLEPDAFVMFADNKDADIMNSKEIVRDDIFIESRQRNSERDNLNYSSSGVTLEMLSIIPYYLVNYTKMNNLYLVVGGETGLSSQAVQLGKSEYKFRVNIPMLNNVESLNVSAAVAILTHELKRQFDIVQRKEVEDKMDSVPLPTL